MSQQLDANPARDAQTGRIIGAAVEVHRHIGPGLLEAVYHKCLGWELRTRNVPVEQNVLLPLSYKGTRLGTGFRIDLLVDHTVIIEVKSVASLLPVHEAQLLTYMKLAGIRKGLLINFNVPVLKDGVRRFVL